MYNQLSLSLSLEAATSLLASHAEVLRGECCINGAGMCDKPLRTSVSCYRF